MQAWLDPSRALNQWRRQTIRRGDAQNSPLIGWRVCRDRLVGCGSSSSRCRRRFILSLHPPPHFSFSWHRRYLRSFLFLFSDINKFMEKYLRDKHCIPLPEEGSVGGECRSEWGKYPRRWIRMVSHAPNKRGKSIFPSLSSYFNLICKLCSIQKWFIRNAYFPPGSMLFFFFELTLTVELSPGA